MKLKWKLDYYGNWIVLDKNNLKKIIKWKNKTKTKTKNNWNKEKVMKKYLFSYIKFVIKIKLIKLWILLNQILI